jgi:hypothetical protein
VRAKRMAREQMADRLLPALEAGRRAFAAAL